MENRAHAIVAVTFLLVFSLGSIFVYYWLANHASEPLIYQVVTDQSVGGLSAQSRVTFKGLTVGHVADIHFDPDDPTRVIIRLSLERDAYVSQATYAVLASQGLIGGTVLELELGDGSREPLPTNAQHPARIPMHQGLLADLKTSVRHGMQSLDTLLERMNTLLGKANREHLSDTLAQLDTATRKLNHIEDQLTPTLDNLPALMKATRQTLQDSRRLLEQATQLVKTARIPVDKASQLEDNIQSLLHTSRQLGRQLNKQTVPRINTLSDSLHDTSRQLNRLLRELQSNPQSLIFGSPQPPPGPGEGGDKWSK